jgi:hypothetical protein
MDEQRPSDLDALEARMDEIEQAAKTLTGTADSNRAALNQRLAEIILHPDSSLADAIHEHLLRAFALVDLLADTASDAAHCARVPLNPSGVEALALAIGDHLKAIRELHGANAEGPDAFGVAVLT